MRSTFVSVILCAHNPRRDYIARAVAALRDQTLDMSRWELIVVDNASRELLVDYIDIGWHPQASLLREDELGLTAARVCGIGAAQGDLLVCVDDDNLLAPNYLEKAIEISDAWPQLGAWGGQLQGEFETNPAAVAEYLHLIAVGEFSDDRWSNGAEDQRSYPCGAGLCIRGAVARHWVDLVKYDGRRKFLARTGDALMGGEDIDMVLTGLSMGYGMGRFTSLKAIHLIPSFRLQPEYLVRLAAGSAWSDIWLRGLWGREMPIRGPVRAMLAWMKYRFKSRLERRIFDARERAMRAARAKLRKADAR